MEKELTFTPYWSNLNTPYSILREIESTETLGEYLSMARLEINPSVSDALKQTFETTLASEDSKYRKKPKTGINWEKLLVVPVNLKVFQSEQATIQGLDNVKPVIPMVGLSVIVKSKGKVIALQRSMSNDSNKGHLGLAASYMLLEYDDFENRRFPISIISPKELILRNIITLLSREFGLRPKDFSSEPEILGKMAFNYPYRQEEILVEVNTQVEIPEMIERLSAVKEGPVENRIFTLTDQEYLTLLNLKVAGAPHHLLGLGLGLIDDVKFLIKQIKNLPWQNKPFSEDIKMLIQK